MKVNSMSRLRIRRNVKKVVNLEKIGALLIPEWWLDEYFGPVECFIGHIDRDVEMSASELPSRYQLDVGLYDQVSRIFGMAEAFEIAKKRDASCPCSRPLFRMAEKLGARKLLSSQEIHELRNCLRELRAYARSKSRSQMIDLIMTARIKLEMRKLDEGELLKVC